MHRGLIKLGHSTKCIRQSSAAIRSSSSSSSSSTTTSISSSSSSPVTYNTKTGYEVYNGVITPEAIKHYQTDTKTLARWLDIGIIKYQGRAYNADKQLIDINNTNIFPTIKGSTLNGKEITFPNNDDIASNNVTLVVFSFKHYGFSLVRSWIDPYIKHFQPNIKSNKIKVIELCFVEYSFMSWASKIFANNLKLEINEDQHNSTILVFGNLSNFASQLLLPSKYIGYCYLLDKNNKIRWRGCGNAKEEELNVLYKCSLQLLKE